MGDDVVQHRLRRQQQPPRVGEPPRGRAAAPAAARVADRHRRDGRAQPGGQRAERAPSTRPASRRYQRSTSRSRSPPGPSRATRRPPSRRAALRPAAGPGPAPGRRRARARRSPGASGAGGGPRRARCSATQPAWARRNASTWRAPGPRRHRQADAGGDTRSVMRRAPRCRTTWQGKGRVAAGRRAAG